MKELGKIINSPLIKLGDGQPDRSNIEFEVLSDKIREALQWVADKIKVETGDASIRVELDLWTKKDAVNIDGSLPYFCVYLVKACSDEEWDDAPEYRLKDEWVKWPPWYRRKPIAAPTEAFQEAH